MKIHRSQLPADIAAALAPRTFGEALPEDGQHIEALCKTYGWTRGKFDPEDRFIENENGFMELTDSVQWRPILEIEDDAPEPETAQITRVFEVVVTAEDNEHMSRILDDLQTPVYLPKETRKVTEITSADAVVPFAEVAEAERELPEPGSVFLANGMLARRGEGRSDIWSHISDENFRFTYSGSGVTHPISTIPADWQPLSEVIEQAARVKELEAIEEGLNATVGRLESALDQTRLRYRDHVVTIETLNQTVHELEAKLQARNARIAGLDEALGAVERTADEMADRCLELEAKLKQQHELIMLYRYSLDFDDGIRASGQHREQIEEAIMSLYGPKRKAQEASE